MLSFKRVKEIKNYDKKILKIYFFILLLVEIKNIFKNINRF